MTRRISKHGTVYTEGSSQTPAGEMPRVCETCRERIFTSRQSFQHHVDIEKDGTVLMHRAWHIPGCSPFKRQEECLADP